MSQHTIAVLVGSLRRESFNRKPARGRRSEAHRLSTEELEKSGCGSDRVATANATVILGFPDVPIRRELPGPRLRSSPTYTPTPT